MGLETNALGVKYFVLGLIIVTIWYQHHLYLFLKFTVFLILPWYLFNLPTDLKITLLGNTLSSTRKA